MNCDLCDAVATVHFTAVRDGKKRSRSFCEVHAEQEIGPSFRRSEVRAPEMAESYRRLAAFINENKRVPNPEESLRLRIPFTSADGEDALAYLLRNVQRFVSFFDEHGRLPKDGEIEED